MRRRHPHRSLSLALVFAHVFTFLGPADLLRVGSWRLPVGPSPAQAQAAPPPATVGLEAGTNLFAFPREVPPEADTCFELLTFLGGPGVVSRVARLDPMTQQYSECAFAAGGAPAGVDFAVAEGEGYVVDMLAPAQVVLATTASCPALDLEPGVNLVGVSAPFVDQSCFDVLQDLGEGTISASERLNRVTGRGEVCAFDPDDGQTDLLGGRDYSIVPGEGYLLHLEQAVSGYQPNDLAMCSGVCGDGVVNLGEECDGANDSMCPGQCSAACTCPALTCQPPDPSQGPPGAVVTLRGTGFLPGSTTVRFNGQPISPGFASPTRLDVTVPAGVTAGPVDVTVDYPTGTDTVSCGAFTPNAGPVLDPIGDRTVLLGQQIEFTVSASDPDPGQDVTLSVTPAPLPLGATFEPRTGDFRFLPGIDHAGETFPLTFCASDGQLEACETIDLTVETPLQGTLSGKVLSVPDLCPLEGVVMKAGLDGGVQSSSPTDSAGTFTLPLDGVPTNADGTTPLIIDGTQPGIVRHCPNGDTVLNEEAVPELPKIREAVRLLPGAANLVNCRPDTLCVDGERPFLLPVLATSSGSEIDPAQDTMVTSPLVGICDPDAFGNTLRCDPSGDAEAQCGAGRSCTPRGEIQFEVASGTAKDVSDPLQCTNPSDPGTCPDFTGTASITPVQNRRSPIELPEGFDFSVYFALQPFGVSYDPPQPICFPNVEDFPSGSKHDIFAMDPDIGEFIQLGTGTVCGPTGTTDIPEATNPMCSADSSLICSDGGVVRFGSWHGILPRLLQFLRDFASDPASALDGLICSSGSQTCMKTGNLAVSHEIPTYRSQGRERGMELVYHSSHAAPAPYVSRFYTPGNVLQRPNTISSRLEFAGVEQGPEVFYGTDFCGNASCPLARFARVADGSAFESGVYPATLEVRCNFNISLRNDVFRQNTAMINQISSPIGAGWWIQGLERIHRTATGQLLLVDGRAEPAVFTPAVKAAAEIGRAGEEDAYILPASRGNLVTVTAARRSNLTDGTGSLNPQVELRDSRGFVVARDDDSGELRVSGPGADASLQAIDLPATDTYTLAVTGAGGTTGPYDLFVTVGGADALVAESLEAPLDVAPEFSFEGAIPDAGARTEHAFSANGGSRVTITVDRIANQPGDFGTLDPSVELVDSRGFVVARDSDGGSNVPPGPGLNARISEVDLLATDTYRLIVSGQNGTVGPYQLSVRIGGASGSFEIPEAGSAFVDTVVRGPAGDASTLRELADGSFERLLEDGTRNEYDTQGRILRAIDRNNNETTYAYDLEGRLRAITDPVGLQTTLRYDVDTGSAAQCGQALDEIEDPAGRITRLVHDAECNLIELQGPDGARRAFNYDERHLMLSQTAPRGLVEEALGSQGAAMLAAAGLEEFVTRYEYDASGRLGRAVLPDGSERLLATAQSLGLPPLPADCEPPTPDPGCEGAPLEPIARSEVDVRFTDAEGAETNFGSLDGSGRPTTTVDAAGRVTTTERDAAGRVTRLLEPSGVDQSSTYDDTGALATVLDNASGRRSRITRDSFGLETVVEDPGGNALVLERAPNGDLRSATTPEGRRLEFAVDTDGRVAEILSPRSTTQLAYDAERRLAAVRTEGDESLRETTLEYDDAGNPIRIEDVRAGVIVFNYDNADRIVRRSGPGFETVNFEYDPSGNLVALNPQDGPPQRFHYDARDRVVGYAIGPQGEAAVYEFDRNDEGEVVGIRLPGDGAIAIARDPNTGRIVRFETSAGSRELTHDAATGLLERIQTPNGVDLDLGYDGPTPARQTWSGEVQGEVEFEYGMDRQVSAFVIEGERFELTRDRDGLLTDAGDLDITREAATGLEKQTVLGAVRTEAVFNDFEEPVLERAIVNGETIVEVSLERDVSGRIFRKSETIAGETRVLEFDYDAAGNLAEVRQDGNLLARYTYDANGNRRSITTPSEEEIADYDEQGRLVSLGGTTYVFSDEGELILRTEANGDTTRYEYDDFGNLIRVILPDGTVIEYLYDGLNRRVGKKVDGVLVQTFLYLDESRPAALLDGLGNVVARFVYGTRENVPDYMLRDGTRFRILSDEEGSPTLVVNAETGEIRQQIRYGPLGEIVEDTSPGFQPFGSQGGVVDQDTGLVHHGSRDYDPEVGRWTTRGSIDFSDPSPNPYAANNNDPKSQVRTNGLIDRIADAARNAGIPKNPTDAIKTAVETAVEIGKCLARARKTACAVAAIGESVFGEEGKRAVNAVFPDSPLADAIAICVAGAVFGGLAGCAAASAANAVGIPFFEFAEASRRAVCRIKDRE